MEHFRNETLEYFGGERGEKHCVKVSNKKKKAICRFVTILWQKNHSTVIRGS